MRYKILFLLSILLLVMPFIYAYELQDSVEQQISGNQINYQMDPSINQEEFLKMVLQNNPEVAEILAKVVFFVILIVILSIIDIILRGIGMWRASKNNSKIWFWVLLIVNTLCILPIIYLVISRKSKHKKK